MGEEIGSAAVLSRLLEERPTFHFDQTHDWSLGGDALRVVADAVQPGWSMLETGCGYSTVVLAASGAKVCTIAPSPYEHAAILRWCDEAGVSTDHLTWHETTSELALPSLDLGSLDLVLIDGAHAFPMPFIDWFYAARALRPRGVLLVDDTHLPAPRVLRDFLVATPESWRLTSEVDDCAFFERVGSDPLVPPNDWQGQALWTPYPVSPMERVGMAASSIRRRVRLRSRLRSLARTRRGPA